MAKFKAPRLIPKFWLNSSVYMLRALCAFFVYLKFYNSAVYLSKIIHRKCYCRIYKIISVCNNRVDHSGNILKRTPLGDHNAQIEICNIECSFFRVFATKYLESECDALECEPSLSTG